MGYKKAARVLPEELLASIQQYVDGEYLYIPRRTESKKSWGSSTNIRSELKVRNENIYADYSLGWECRDLADKYYLSIKSIQRIIRQSK